MKKLLFLILAAGLVCSAQTPVFSRTETFTAAAAGTTITNIGGRALYYRLYWYPIGAPGSCTVAVDSSTDGSSWSAGNVIAGQTCTTPGSVTLSTAAVYNYVRINVTALSANKSVTVTVAAYETVPTGATGTPVLNCSVFPGADAGAKITACIAALPATGGVADARGLAGSQTISSQIAIPSDVEVLLGAGTYDFTGTGSAFKGTSVTACILRGLGVDATVIQAHSTGTQKGDLVQFLTTTNCVLSDITLNANGNATNSLTTQNDTGSVIQNVKLVHDSLANTTAAACVLAGHNYAWSIRGSDYLDAFNVEISGGCLDGIFEEAQTAYSAIAGGSFSHINTHDSFLNCIDITATGAAFPISAQKWSDVRASTCGTRNVGADDEFGINIFSASSGPIQDNSFVNLDINGNKMSGLRLKGLVQRNNFNGVASQSNGAGVGGGDAVKIEDGGGTDYVTNNSIHGTAILTGANKAVSSTANSSNNLLDLNVAGGATAVGIKDVLLSVAANGKYGIGTSAPSFNVDIAGTPSSLGGSTAHLFLEDSRSQAADQGGAVAFGFVYTGTSVAEAAYIAGRKENGTDGQYGSYLAFATRTNGGSTTEALRINSAGLFSKANRLTTVESGIAVAAWNDSATAQTANIAANDFSPAISSAVAARYRATCYVAVTQQATTSSTVPFCNLICTDPTDSVAKTVQVTPAIQGVAVNPTTGVGVSGSGMCDAKVGTAIQWSTTGYASVGATAMAYKIYIVLEQM